MNGETQQTFLAVFLKRLKLQTIHHNISVQNLDEKSRVFECCVITEQNVVLLIDKSNV
jgi:hypothetical protein